jgi:hypothetical protein
MSYPTVLTFLLLLSGFSFAQLNFPHCPSGSDEWVRPSDLFVQTFFESLTYCIVQALNTLKQDACEVAAYLLAVCNGGSMLLPLCLPLSRHHLSRSVYHSVITLFVLHTTKQHDRKPVQVQHHRIFAFS